MSCHTCECVGDCLEKRRERIRQIHEQGAARLEAKKRSKQIGRITNADFEKAFQRVAGWKGTVNVAGAAALIAKGNPGDFAGVLIVDEKHPRGHWCGLMIELGGAHWFDSLGGEPAGMSVISSRKRIQHHSSIMCGLFTIEYLRAWIRGKQAEFMRMFDDPADSDRILLGQYKR